MKAIEDLVMIIGDYKHQIEQLQKENEKLKASKKPTPPPPAPPRDRLIKEGANPPKPKSDKK